MLSTDPAGKLNIGVYFSKLLEYVEIFEELYARYSVGQIEGAIEHISDLLQLPQISDTGGEFFVDTVEFLILDQSKVEEFLSEKLAIIMCFMQMALNRRKQELGMFYDNSEWAANERLSANQRETVIEDLALIDWFLTGELCTQLESYYTTTPVRGFGILVDVPVDTLDSELKMIYDDSNRPLK